jgi:predicted component of type VI protein secretion system
MLSVRVENCATHQLTEHTFQRSPVRIGRNALNELTLLEGYVSLSHAVLRFDPEKIQIIDLGSTNGTHVDGVRIESNVPVTLKDSSELRIGDLRLHLRQVSGVSSNPALQNRDRTQFRMMTQDVRAAVTPFPAVPAPATPAHPVVAGARVPAPPTQFVSSAGSLPLGAAPAPPTPMPAAPAVSPPTPARVAVSSFAQPTDSGATLLDVDLLHVALEQDLASRPAADEALARDVAAAAYPLYAEYRKAWRQLHEALQSKAGHLPVAQRAALAEVLERQMPSLQQEEQFRAFAGIAPAESTGAIRVGQGPADRLLSVFASAYGAGERRLATPEDVDGFLDRLGELLETFATSFIELRRGQAEFGNQIAVRTITADTAVRRARTPKELLHLLLDPGSPGEAHLDDVKAGFGEVMFHQVALLSGTREGVKALLEELDPVHLARPPAQPGSAAQNGSLAYLWPAVLWTRWRRFSEVWRRLGEEEEALRILFGPEFARAYAMVMGGQLSPAKAARPNLVSRTEKKPVRPADSGPGGTDKLPPK